MDSWHPHAVVGLARGVRWYRRLRCGQFYYKAFLEVAPSADPVLVESLMCRPGRFQILTLTFLKGSAYCTGQVMYFFLHDLSPE